MILDQIDKLIEQCFLLIESDRKSDRKLFQHYINPVFKQFEIVHEGYKNILIKYRDLILYKEAEFNKSHPVFAELANDPSLGKDRKAKLKELADYSKDKPWGVFLRGIARYVRPGLPKNRIFTWAQAGPGSRSTLARALAEVAEAELEDDFKKGACVVFIDSKISIFRNSYLRIKINHLKLK